MRTATDLNGCLAGELGLNGKLFMSTVHPSLLLHSRAEMSETVDPLVHMVNGFRLSGGHFKHMSKSTISMAQVEITPFQAHPSPPLCIASIDMTSDQEVTKSLHRKQYHTQILHIHCQVRYGEEITECQNGKPDHQ